MNLTVEEMYLLDGCDMSSRKAAIHTLLADISHVRDTDLKQQMVRACSKLINMSDEEFEKMDFTIDED